MGNRSRSHSRASSQNQSTHSQSTYSRSGELDRSKEEGMAAWDPEDYSKDPLASPRKKGRFHSKDVEESQVDPVTREPLLQVALESGVFAFNIARSFTYALQQWSLPLIERLLFERTREPVEHNRKDIEILYRELISLLKRDAKNIAAGTYPLSVVKLESPIEQWFKFAKVVADGRRIHRRRKNHKIKDFGHKITPELDEYPEYYRRNFHFQTDGYLSDESANLYDTQVDILFAGATDAMRRMVVPLLKKRESLRAQRKLRFLEVGAGVGNLTRDMRKAFPRAGIVALDLSSPYLEKAKAKIPGLETVVGAGEDLPFKAETFDLVYSCFLFHELPRAIREQHLQEAMRVLKPGGYVAIVDSLQRDDDPRLNWALENFPRDYHEPFYKDYTLDNLRELLETNGFQVVDDTHGFLAKAIVGKKRKTALSD